MLLFSLFFFFFFFLMIRRPPRSTLFPYRRSSDLTMLNDGTPVAPMMFEQPHAIRSEEHTSELQSRFGISYAVFCLKKKKSNHTPQPTPTTPHGTARQHHTRRS